MDIQEQAANRKAARRWWQWLFGIGHWQTAMGRVVLDLWGRFTGN